MTTIRTYTTIEQSRKLAEILPLESADGYWFKGFPAQPYMVYTKGTPNPGEHIPCWSLASLLEQLDDEINDEEGNDYNLTIVKEELKYQLYYHDSWGQAEDIETDYYDDMVDACYEMILKLKELNLFYCDYEKRK